MLGVLYFFNAIMFPAIGILLTVRALEILNFKYQQSRKNEIESQNHIEYVLNNAHEAIVGFSQSMIATT